jgi:glycine oxidase
VVVRGGRAAGVETAAGLIESDWVVHCAGPWAGEEIGLPFALPAIPARGQILQFSTRTPLFRRVVKSPRAYLVQRADGCLIAGTTLEYAGFEKRTTEEGIQQIQAGVKEISAEAGRLPVESAWAGLRPDTPDHLPVLGPTPLEGFLAAFGHFRNGILLAPLTGRLIADSILGVRSSLDLAPFGISRFMIR